MLKIAICEDNKATLDLITRLVEFEFKSRNLSIACTSYLFGSVLLNHFELNPYDIVFLDIAMPEINGFDVAKKLRQFSSKTFIIFITTENGLVYDSFDYQPCYFIPKSSIDFLKMRLNHVISRLLIHLSLNEMIYLDLPYNEKKYIEVCDLIYIKSEGNYLDYHINMQKTIRLRGKLDTITEILNPKIFARTHKRYLINMRYIDTFDISNFFITLKDSTNISISRNYKKSFEDSYYIYLQNFN